MKKILKPISLLLVSALMLTLFACGKKITDVPGTSVKNEVTDVPDTSVKSDETRTGTEDTEDSDVTDVPGTSVKEEDTQVPGTYVLNSGTDMVYVIDENGKMVISYDLAELREKAGNEYYTFYPYSLIDVYDGKLIFSEYLPINDDTSNYGYVIYAIDPETLEIQRLWNSGGRAGNYFQAGSVYNGDLYITVSEDGIFKEYKFKKGEQGLETDLSDYCPLLETLNPENLRLYFESGDGIRNCLTKTFEDAGYLMAYDNTAQDYVRIFKDGHKEEISDMPESYCTVVHYDSDCLIYSCYSYSYDDENPTGLFYHDIKADSTKKLENYDPSNDGVVVLCYNDGLLYMFKYTGTEYGHDIKQFFTLDPVTEKSELTYELEDIPGSKNQMGIIGLADNYKVINGNIIAPAVIDKKIVWATVTWEGNKPVFTDISCPIQELSALKYGNVYYGSYTAACSECGTILEKDYVEYFQADKAQIKGADKINELLKNVADTYLADLGDGTIEPYDAEECEYHQEYPEGYCITYDATVQDVEFIKDKYFSVRMESYWYGGGAHGSTSFNQYLFDPDTGRRLTIKDFYLGSEEDFKTLCAKKTVEDLENYSEEYSSPYYTENPDDLYKDAYDTVSFEHSNISYDEDGIYLVYEPYEIGPYSSGFISIKLFGPEIYD